MHRFSEISGKSCRSFRSENSAQNTEQKSEQGYCKHDKSGPDNIVHIRSADSYIDDPSHKYRNDHLAYNLSDHAQRRQY